MPSSLEYDPARSVNPELANGNAIIEGENLEILKCLLAPYRTRIRCIYIDPPYNKDKDFVYSDTWKEDRETYWEHIGVTTDGVKVDTNTKADGRFHSNWLNMLYPRLLLARQHHQEVEPPRGVWGKAGCLLMTDPARSPAENAYDELARCAQHFLAERPVVILGTEARTHCHIGSGSASPSANTSSM